MSTDPVVATLAGTIGTALASVLVWVLTSRRRDGAEGDGLIADAASAITESALALVARHEAEVHECRESLARLEGEMTNLYRECDQLKQQVAVLRGESRA